jgi:hypothetical protein
MPSVLAVLRLIVSSNFVALHDRQIGRLFACQNASRVRTGALCFPPAEGRNSLDRVPAGPLGHCIGLAGPRSVFLAQLARAATPRGNSTAVCGDCHRSPAGAWLR